MDYLYDGTFEGLLCCIYAHYYGEKAEGIFQREVYQQNMLCRFCEIATEGEKATRVYEAIRDKISRESLRRIYAVYLSSEAEREMKILRYVVLGFRLGGRVNLLHGEPVVYDVQQAEAKVYAERHRYLGILRFSAVQADRSAAAEGGRAREVLYARLEPDHDIIELMAPHFADRYKNDPFILHDIRRQRAVFAEGGHWYVSELSRDAWTELAQGEREYRRLWKQYFETIAIRERTNPSCQKRCMPVRYWKHLTEFQQTGDDDLLQ